MISNLGKGALCGKIDIKSAFRLLIVSPSDFDLVGIYLIKPVNVIQMDINVLAWDRHKDVV
jgi:hypothetical protein